MSLVFWNKIKKKRRRKKKNFAHTKISISAFPLLHIVSCSTGQNEAPHVYSCSVKLDLLITEHKNSWDWREYQFFFFLRGWIEMLLICHWMDCNECWRRHFGENYTFQPCGFIIEGPFIICTKVSPLQPWANSPLCTFIDDSLCRLVAT